MLFSSIPFLYYFLPAVLLLYFAVPRRIKNVTLLLVSLIFYFYGEHGYVLLLLFSSTADYILGRIIEKYHGTNKAKRALAISIGINLLVLGFFKYADFIVMNINALFDVGLPLLRIHLPLGISFFTFQTMSYTIDVYRGTAAAERGPLSFAMYVSMFPQLVAGPIVRYNTVAAELQNRTHSFENFAAGTERFTMGLAKKVLLANALGELSVTMLATETPSVLAHWLAVLAYFFQIYFDFSGYSDMAIGLGLMLGFHFPENFNYPFTAASVSNFWQRWHMSMGTWFREYLYIPLGGNRVSRIKWVRNIFIVWFCTGLWHGANWNYILWGLYFGVLLAVEKLFLSNLLSRLPKFVGHIYTLTAVFFSFILFYIEDMSALAQHLAGMFGGLDIPASNTESLYYLRSYALLLVVAAIGSTPLPKTLGKRLLRLPQLQNSPFGAIAETIFCIALLLITTGYLIDSSFNPFLYFRF